MPHPEPGESEDAATLSMPCHGLVHQTNATAKESIRNNKTELQLHLQTMSSFFGASEADIENCFSEILRTPRVVVIYLAFIVFFLFVVMGTDQLSMSPSKVMLGLAVIACLLVVYLKRFLFPPRRAEAPVATDAEQTGQEEQQIVVPPFATRRELPDIRIQLALLDREFDERDYDALSALDADVVPVPVMTDEQINDLPSFAFGVQSPPGCTHDINKSVQHEHESSSASNANEKMHWSAEFAWRKPIRVNLSENCLACICSMQAALIHGCNGTGHALYARVVQFVPSRRMVLCNLAG